eukprot:PhF_6_TR7364/c0_g1_i1/m.11093/K02554/mhpD; 2-keto-4-pentenoate hydratase
MFLKRGTLYQSVRRHGHIVPVTRHAATDYIHQFYKPPTDGKPPPGTVYDLLPSQGEGLSEGYVFQDYAISELELQGDRVVGWRVQGNSDANRRRLQTQETYCGPIMQSVLVNNPNKQPPISINGFQGLDAEVSVAFEIIEEPPVESTMMDVPKFLGKMYPVFELLGCRMPLRPMSVPTHVADFAGMGTVILGNPIENWSKINFAETHAVLHLNGVPIALAKGAHVAGTPMAAIKYLTKHLPSRKRSLKKGDIVCTGSWAAVRLVPGKYLVHFGPLGSFSVDVAP